MSATIQLWDPAIDDDEFDQSLNEIKHILASLLTQDIIPMVIEYISGVPHIWISCHAKGLIYLTPTCSPYFQIVNTENKQIPPNHTLVRHQNHLYIIAGDSVKEVNIITKQYSANSTKLPLYHQNCVVLLMKHSSSLFHHQIVLIGGEAISPHSYYYTNLIELGGVTWFDPTTHKSIRSTQRLNQARQGAAGVCMNNSRIIICGGMFNSIVLSTCEMLDTSIKDQPWRPIACLTQARSYAAAVLVEGRVWICGGMGSHSSSSSSSASSVTDSIEEYDDIQDCWHELPIKLPTKMSLP